MLKHIAEQHQSENMSMEEDIQEKDKQDLIEFIGVTVGEAYLATEERESRVKAILELIQ